MVEPFRAGSFQPAALHWRQTHLPDRGRVAAIREGRDGRVWAVGERHRHAGPRWTIWQRQIDSWISVFETDERLAGVCEAHDSALIANGERFTAHFRGDAWVVRPAPATFSRLWAAHHECVYGLTRDGLYYFDGAQWHAVQLPAPWWWSDGDCRLDGTGWVVGCYGTHSCMAQGSGFEWQAGGCSSVGLDLVCLDEVMGFALGGDGLWQLHDGAWGKVKKYGQGPGIPLSLAIRTGSPLVLARRYAWSVPSDGPANVVYGFVDGRWIRIDLPVPLPAEPGVDHVAVLSSGAILQWLASTIWESTPLDTAYSVGPTLAP